MSLLLLFNGVAAGVTVDATSQTLVLTTYPANISAGIEVNAGTDVLILTEYQANIALDINVNATSQTLVLTEYPATVTTSMAVDVLATSQALVLTEYPATISLDINVQATAQSLTLTSYAATVDATTAVISAAAPPSRAGRSRTKGRIAIRYDGVVYLFQTADEAEFWLESLAVKEDIKPITVIKAPKKIRQLVRKVNNAEDDAELMIFLLEVA